MTSPDYSDTIYHSIYLKPTFHIRFSPNFVAIPQSHSVVVFIVIVLLNTIHVCEHKAEKILDLHATYYKVLI